LIYIAVCDDEEYYREKIKHLLNKYFHKYQIDFSIDVFSSGEEFYEQAVGMTKYDIVFLDINMKEMNGIDLAHKLRTYKQDVYIVFVTGYVNYALEGYKVDAIRYIMKDTLTVSMVECMNTIIKKMQIQINKIEFNFMNGKKQIFTDKILYIESCKHKLIFKIFETVLMEYEMYDKLDNIEMKLRGFGFLRIHKSYLINMKYIKQMNNYKAILITNEELPIPKLRYQEVKEAFILYKGEL
jgi:DNA-binding LytR/AlgR family response regulator